MAQTIHFNTYQFVLLKREHWVNRQSARAKWNKDCSSPLGHPLKLYFRLSFPCRSSAMELAGPRSLLESPLQYLHSRVSGKFIPSLEATEHPSSDGPASVHRGPCAHRALHPWGIYTQTKFWVFGYDPGITSTKSMDFPRIYFSIMS